MKKRSRLKLIFINLFILSSAVSTYFFFTNISSTLVTTISFLIFIFTLASLLYLSYYDLLKMEVQNSVSLLLLLFFLLLNLLPFLFLGPEKSFQITKSLTYIPYDNLLAALILGGVFLLTVILSKETLLGLGDVRIVIAIGLIIGVGNLWLWLNITVFSALFYGLLIAYEKRVFKGLKIPLVPFMVLGTIIVLLFRL
ncbi:prepilin peptidase [Candidatus Dojkabacteria bacterium]|nr:prepilin peptidase [Candidatus Dojkabacteria bacterium]